MEDKTNTGAQGADKTFSQAELDAIVDKRLERERGKYADYETLKAKAAKFDEAEEKAKSELQKAQELAAGYKAQLEARDKELATARARGKVAAETGVPEGLLSGETEEACRKQAAALLKWRGDAPSVPNRGIDHLLGGSPSKGSKPEDAAYETLLDGLFPKN